MGCAGTGRQSRGRRVRACLESRVSSQLFLGWNSISLCVAHLDGGVLRVRVGEGLCSSPLGVHNTPLEVTLSLGTLGWQDPALVDVSVVFTQASPDLATRIPWSGTNARAVRHRFRLHLDDRSPTPTLRPVHLASGTCHEPLADRTRIPAGMSSEQALRCLLDGRPSLVAAVVDFGEDVVGLSPSGVEVTGGSVVAILPAAPPAEAADASTVARVAQAAGPNVRAVGFRATNEASPRGAATPGSAAANRHGPNREVAGKAFIGLSASERTGAERTTTAITSGAGRAATKGPGAESRAVSTNAGSKSTEVLAGSAGAAFTGTESTPALPDSLPTDSRYFVVVAVDSNTTTAQVRLAAGSCTDTAYNVNEGGNVTLARRPSEAPDATTAMGHAVSGLAVASIAGATAGATMGAITAGSTPNTAAASSSIPGMGGLLISLLSQLQLSSMLADVERGNSDVTRLPSRFVSVVKGFRWTNFRLGHPWSDCESSQERLSQAQVFNSPPRLTKGTSSMDGFNGSDEGSDGGGAGGGEGGEGQDGGGNILLLFKKQNGVLGRAPAQVTRPQQDSLVDILLREGDKCRFEMLSEVLLWAAVLLVATLLLHGAACWAWRVKKGPGVPYPTLLQPPRLEIVVVLLSIPPLSQASGLVMSEGTVLGLILGSIIMIFYLPLFTMAFTWLWVLRRVVGGWPLGGASDTHHTPRVSFTLSFLHEGDATHGRSWWRRGWANATRWMAGRDVKGQWHDVPHNNDDDASQLKNVPAARKLGIDAASKPTNNQPEAATEDRADNHSEGHAACRLAGDSHHPSEEQARVSATMADSPGVPVTVDIDMVKVDVGVNQPDVACTAINVMPAKAGPALTTSTPADEEGQLSVENGQEASPRDRNESPLAEADEKPERANRPAKRGSFLRTHTLWAPDGYFNQWVAAFGILYEDFMGPTRADKAGRWAHIAQRMRCGFILLQICKRMLTGYLLGIVASPESTADTAKVQVALVLAVLAVALFFLVTVRPFHDRWYQLAHSIAAACEVVLFAITLSVVGEETAYLDEEAGSAMLFFLFTGVLASILLQLYMVANLFRAEIGSRIQARRIKAKKGGHGLEAAVATDDQELAAFAKVLTSPGAHPTGIGAMLATTGGEPEKLAQGSTGEAGQGNVEESALQGDAQAPHSEAETAPSSKTVVLIDPF
eukprot:jgi/Mesvir1/16544/Mv10087-RA.1